MGLLRVWGGWHRVRSEGLALVQVVVLLLLEDESQLLLVSVELYLCVLYSLDLVIRRVGVRRRLHEFTSHLRIELPTAAVLIDCVFKLLPLTRFLEVEIGIGGVVVSHICALGLLQLRLSQKPGVLRKLQRLRQKMRQAWSTIG